jgi:DNA repair exonuclease SbcCD ATPase subunit
VKNKMKKLAISVLAIAGACCGVHGMEIQEHHEPESNEYPTYTKLFPKEFWSDTEMVSKCIAEVKEKVIN